MVTNPKAFYSSIFLLGDLNSVWASGNFPNTRGTELLHLQNVTMLVTCLSHTVALAWQKLQLACTPSLPGVYAPWQQSRQSAAHPCCRKWHTGRTPHQPLLTSVCSGLVIKPWGPYPSPPCCHPVTKVQAPTLIHPFPKEREFPNKQENGAIHIDS